MSDALIYTIGHSTRAIEEFLGLLTAAEVSCLVDVRKVPRSGHNPQFGGDALARSLAERAIGYRHEPGLGGFRKPRPDSINQGWQQPAFGAYADYMATAGFTATLSELEALGAERTTSIMCAEAQWWRCHRRLISDALVVRAWQVLHLGLQAHPVPHELTSFAVVDPDGALSYPPAQAELELGIEKRPPGEVL